MPSLNQAEFIEHGIRSVLLQNYPNLEFLVLDGGSQDGTAAILERYAKHFSHWVSKRDRGQSDAINKGLRMATGNLWAYLNSDDYYEPGTLKMVAECYQKSRCDWITGHGQYVAPDGTLIETMQATPFPPLDKVLLRFSHKRSGAIQVSNFMSKRVLEVYGFFDEGLHYCMDMDYGLRLLADGIHPIILPHVLAKARLHSESKTVSNAQSGKFLREDLIVARRFLPRLPEEARLFVAEQLRDLEMFLNLQEVETSSVPWLSFCKMARRHPSYLLRRPAWGLAKKLVLH